MKKDRTIHRKDSYNIAQGVAEINLYNGNFRYTYPIISIGGGNYQIALNLVYGTNQNDWKLNIEQYIKKYEITDQIEGYKEGDYLYVDASFSMHRFIKYDTVLGKDINNNGSNIAIDVYYDSDGTCLKLYIEPSGKGVIIDNNGNQYYFNEEGKLYQITSGVYEKITKIIKRENNKVTIYDQRNKNDNKLEIIYNNKKQLEKISHPSSKRQYLFGYSNNKLTKITYEITAKIDRYNPIKEEKIAFSYNSNGLLESIMDCEDLTALRIGYDTDNKVKEYDTGTFRKTYKTKEGTNEYYIGEEVGYDEYLTGTTKVVDGYDLRYISTDNTITYEYNEGYTSVKNNISNRIIEIYFNKEEKTVAILEKLIGTDKRYYTLDYSHGFKLARDGTSEERMNGVCAIVVKNSNNRYSYKVNEELLEDFKQIFRDEKEKSSEYFTLSFWIKANKEIPTTSLVEIKYKIDDVENLVQAPLEITRGMVWQKVVTTIDLGHNQESLKELEIAILAENMAEEILLAEVKIERGSMSNIYIEGKKIEVGDEISYNNLTKKISSSFYLTSNDFLKTYQSLYHNTDIVKTKDFETIPTNTYELYYNNCTSVVKVKEVTLKKQDSEKIKLDVRKSPYKIDEKVEGVEGICNYITKTYTLINDGSWSLQEEQISFRNYYDQYEEETATKTLIKTYIEVKQSLKTVDTDEYQEIPDEEKKSIYQWQNEDGTFRASKDVNKIITHYYYDSYGNLTSIKKYQEGDESNSITIKSYTYDGLGDEYHEYIAKEETNGEIIESYYDAKFGLCNKEVRGKLEKEYYYDENQRLISVYYKDKDKKDTIDNNDIKYKKGQVSVIKSHMNSDLEKRQTYGFNYNIKGELNEIYYNKKLIASMKNDHHMMTTKIYQQEKKPFTFESYYNRYDMITSEKDSNNNEIKYVYTQRPDFRISSIEDPYTKMTTRYTYDDNSLIPTTTIKNDELQITTDSNNLVQYMITNDEEIVLLTSSKENSFSNNIQENKVIVNETQYIDYSYKYHYDAFSRLIKKSNKEVNEETGFIDKEWEYNKINPSYIDKITYTTYGNNNQTTTLTITNKYLNNNLISMIESDKEYHYEYDNYNRLIKEINPNNQIITYDYDNSSSLIKITKEEGNRVVETVDFVIGDGRVQKIKTVKDNNILEQLINYDNYGNIIKIDDATIDYNHRNLMSQYQKDHKKITYQYNYQGIRYEKRLNEKTIHYIFSGNTILGENWIENNNITTKIRYYYDNEGISGLRYQDYNFTFMKDTLGNISKILYKDKIIGEYIYDAYGNHKIKYLSSNERDKFVLDNNPFRYRGYYYDTETGLFYCNSRYYSPELCRWLTPDSIEYLDPESINGLNLYCYCGNNPVMYADPDGHMPKWLQGLAIGLAVVGVVLVAGAITALTMGVGTTIMATTMAGAIIHGAAVGTLIGAGIGVAAGGIIGGATTNWSAEGILTGMGIGFGGGAIIGAVVGGSVGALQYTSAANSWASGKDSMISHFLDHGKKEGYKNVIQYTKSAKNVIKNGTYIEQTNAFAIRKIGKKFFYVGVAHDSTLITTFFTKTLTITKMILYGLI